MHNTRVSRIEGVLGFNRAGGGEWLAGLAEILSKFVERVSSVDDIVEQVKAKNRIEDVIEESGVPMQHKHGRYLRSSDAEHSSLVVDTFRQTYSWNSKQEIACDVIAWVMNRRGLDFKTAVEELARRAKLPEPKWSREDQAHRLAARVREECFGVAQRVFTKWLAADAAALTYVRGRGWTDETIEESGIGFSGRLTDEQLRDLKGEFSMYGVELESPQAVAILGYHGDVLAWGAKWGIEMRNQANWLENRYIPSLIYKTRIVYPHFVMGRIRTFTSRNVLGAEINAEGREVKAYNLPVVLAGERQLFFNHVYRMNAEECVVVEGQADAITLGQWGLAAAALAGTAWKDHEEALRELKKRHKRVYVGVDADEAGQAALMGGRDKDWPLAAIFGPMGRVVRWAEMEAHE